MRHTTALTFAAGLAIAASSAAAQVYSSAPNAEIPNVGQFVPLTDTITITGGPARIADLNVNLKIQHEYDEDVHAVLQTPYGYINLTTSNGFGQDYLTTRFDDSAASSITSGASPYDGDYRPEGLLNQWAEYDPNSAAQFFGPNYRRLTELNGLSANGDWTLWIEDFNSLFQTGTLLYWSLEFNYASDSNNPRAAAPAPTTPRAKASINYSVFTSGQTARFLIDVTPAYLPTPSTGITATVNASSIGQGTITLLDDGVNDDGVAGNLIFGGAVPVDAALGDYALSYSVQDAQGRATTGTFPTISVVGPGPTCPQGQDPQTFTNLRAFGGWQQDPDNSLANLAFTGTGRITDIHLSGRLASGNTGSFASNAGIAIYFTDGTANLFEPIPDQFNEFSYVDVADADLHLFTPRDPGEIVGIEVYDNFENEGLDETWQTLCLSFETRNTLPIINFAYNDPSSAEPGAAAGFYASVDTGVNPFSTNLTVTVDLSPLGGGSAELFDDGAHNDGDAEDGFYGGDVTIPANAPLGPVTLNVVAADAQGRSASTEVPFTVVGPVQWDETVNGGGDAGDLPASATLITGAGTLGSLSGFIDLDNADMYAINICDPANFSADSSDPRTQFDTQMWLFKANGAGVEFNDDGPNGGSFLDNSFVTEPGTYYLAITSYDYDARDGDGELIWENTPFQGVRAPDGPAATSPISSWSGFNFSTGPYVVNFTGVCFIGSACDPDVNQDGNSDQGDIDYLINVVAGGDNPTNIDPDFNRDGNVDQGDVDALLNVVAGGDCP
ncbi:MAG: hypothetical protein WC718_05465 [Phycisphaerales bacterium]|jgi:subtilisin-like proprotein convertase family protein